MNRLITTFWPALACLALAGGLMAHKASYVSPDDPHVLAYHDEVQQMINRFPRTVGGWQAPDTDNPTDAGAEQLLKANAMVSRTYTNTTTGARLEFLFYHTKDARHMRGHYPPICYPGQGWKLRDNSHSPSRSTPRTWLADRVTIRGMDYDFRRKQTLRNSAVLGSAQTFTLQRMHVSNVLIFPDGTFATNNDELTEFAELHNGRVYGVGQIQIVFHGTRLDADERQSIVQDFLTEAYPAIAAVQAGIPR